MSGNLKITLIKSRFGRIAKHNGCLQGLGLKRINQTVIRENTPCVRGMINKINYLIRVEEA